MYGLSNYPKSLEGDEYIDDNDVLDDIFDYYNKYPFYKNKRSPLTFSRRRRGIIEECCYSACSKQDLLMYCGK